MANVEKLMNDVETRMAKEAEQKEKKKNRKVYRFKKLSTPHIVLYPLMILCWYYEKLIEKIYSLYKWNEKRADTIITRDIICHGEINKGVIYYYCRWWNQHWGSKGRSRLRDRTFCRKFNGKLTERLVNEYQLEGYTKEIETDDEWYNITFTRLEEQ